MSQNQQLGLLGQVVSVNSTANSVTLTSTIVVGNSTVNTNISANSFTVNGVTIVNTTNYAGTANNANNLGGTAAASFVQNTDSRTLSGNLNFSGANNYFNTAVYVGANVVVNTSAHYVANSTANAALTVNSLTLANSSSQLNLTSTSVSIGSGGTTLATGQISVANSTGNVQITAGTTSILATGSINAASYTVGTAFTSNSTVTNTVSLVVSTNTATIGTGTYFVSNGNVGIGNNTPASKLAVIGTGGATISLTSNTTAQYDGAYLNLYASGASANYGMTSLQHILMSGSADLTNYNFQIQQRSTTNAYVATVYLIDYKNGNHLWYSPNTGSERMKIDSTGNINIGGGADAGNALRYVDVYNTNTGASAGSIIRLITSNVAASTNITVDLVKYKTGGFYINNNETNSAAFTAFTVGASERMRITSGGYLGINTTAPIRRFHLQDGTTGAEMSLTGSSATGTAFLNISDNLGSNGGGWNFILRGLGTAGTVGLNLNSVTINSNLTYFAGDVRAYRSYSTGTGIYYFGQGDAYMFYDGSYFNIVGGYVYNGASFRAPVFYDSDNTGYYLNPYGDSNISGNIYIGEYYRSYGNHGLYNQSYDNHFYADNNAIYNVAGSAGTNGGLRFRDGYAGTIRGYVYWDGGENFGLLNKNGAWNYRGFVDGAEFYGTNQYLVYSRAYIYYDRDDSGYYVNPNGNSHLYSLNLYGNDFHLLGGSPTMWFDDTDGEQCGILHNNSSTLYILRRDNLNVGWTTVGSGNWPMLCYLYSNDFVFGGAVTSIYGMYQNASDRRLKDNIVEISNAIDKIKQIRGVTFSWNATADAVGFIPDQRDDVGVIAQEIQAVLPQAVHRAPFDTWTPSPDVKMTKEEVQEKRKESKSGENYLTVQTEKIVPLLIEGIKEQQLQIESLQKQIDDLINMMANKQ